MSSDDVLLTCSKVCVATVVEWVTLSNDVMKTSAEVFWHVRDPGGMCNWWLTHVSSNKGQILGFRNSTNNKAYIAARVTKIRSRSWESLAMFVRRFKAFVHAWRCVQLPMGTSFLGFRHGRPLSTSVWLVSLGKASMCTDLKEIGMDYLSLWSETWQWHNDGGSMGAMWCNGS